MPYICQICLKSFSRSNRLQSHLNKKKPCKPPLAIDPPSQPSSCNPSSTIKKEKAPPFEFSKGPPIKITLKSQKITLKDEIILLKEQIASQNIQLTQLAETQIPLKTLELLEEIREQVSHNNKQIAELKEKPMVNNQILQIVCVGQNDNYLDMLTQQYGNFERALEFIKDCALSQLSGDCKLINKIYFESQKNQPSIQFLDKKRTKIEYFNEKKEKISDSKEMFSRRIANNLQNSYLKGVNHLINKNLESRGCPNKFLDDYDIQEWNSHIYTLSDEKYQKKIVNQLNIPIQ